MADNKKMNMEEFDNYVFVMVNDNMEQSAWLKFSNCMHHNSLRLGNRVDRLDPQYFVVENHSDEIYGTPKYVHLANSIDEHSLHQEEYGLLSYIKHTIPISTFTIFINGQNVFPYYPLSIATVDISSTGGDIYMYINGLSDSEFFCNSESRLMDSIKMIARIYHCCEIRYHCDEEFERTRYLFEEQGFIRVDSDTIVEEGLLHNLVYIPSEEDRYYQRGSIEGHVSVVTEESGSSAEDLKYCSLIDSF
jgi:hypothetical protein